MAWPHPVEDAVDGMLSWISGGPLGMFTHIRNILHDVLHPFAYAIDAQIVWLYDLANMAQNFASILFNLARIAWQAAVQEAKDLAAALFNAVVALLHLLINATTDLAYGLFNQVVGLAHTLYVNAVDFARGVESKVVGLAQTLYNNAVSFAQGVESRVVGLAQTLYNGAVSFAQGVEARVIGFAQSVYNGAISFAQGVETRVGRLAQTLVDGAQRLAAAALAAFYRDVIAPIERTVGDVVDELFGWAKPLLDVVEGALHWLQWVTDKGLPALMDGWRALADFDPGDVGALMSGGHAAAHDQLPRVFNGAPGRTR